MSIPIGEIRGVPVEVATKFGECSIENAEQFLVACRTPSGRRKIARALGIKMSVLMELEMSAFLEVARRVSSSSTEQS